MYCRKCGGFNEDGAATCSRCGAPLVQPAEAVPVTQEKIPNYLVWAILSTVLCCLPFGIVAIIYAAGVNAKARAGDIAGAMESSRKAKMWCWIAFGCGLAAIAIQLILMIIGGIASQAQ